MHELPASRCPATTALLRAATRAITIPPCKRATARTAPAGVAGARTLGGQSPAAPRRHRSSSPRQGTGPFVARQLVEHGTDVVAVLTTSSATADACAAQVSALTQRPCQAFTSAAAMLEWTDLDAVAICSPAAAHAEHLRLALHFALDTFCEKPLVGKAPRPLPRSPGRRRNHRRVHRARRRPARQHAMDLHPAAPGGPLRARRPAPCLRSLRVELQPPVRGAAMVPEAVPHANSLLLALSAAGEAGDLHVSMSPRPRSTWISPGTQDRRVGPDPSLPRSPTASDGATGNRVTRPSR